MQDCLQLKCHFLCCSIGVFTAAFDCQIEWLIVKGITDYADGSQLPSESWSSCASVMAASLVAHILSEPCVFHSWPHYQGKYFSYCYFPFWHVFFFYGNQWCVRMYFLVAIVSSTLHYGGGATHNIFFCFFLVQLLIFVMVS